MLKIANVQLEYNRGNPASGVRGRTPDKTRQDKTSTTGLAPFEPHS